MATIDNQSLFKIIICIILFVLRVADQGTDIIAIKQFILGGHTLWGTITCMFLLLPIISQVIGQVLDDLQKGEAVLTTCMWIPMYICVVIVMPAAYLVYGVKAIITGKDPYKVSKDGGWVKLKEVIQESLPQALLGQYIITQVWPVVEAWQWETVVASLIALTFTVGFNSFLFENAKVTSQVVFFFFGLMAVCSRLLVCCLLSMIQKPLLLLPIFIEFISSISAWLYKKFRVGSVPLAEDIHNSREARDMVIVLITWILTTMYNCFTLSGLPASTVNLIFAFSWWFIPETEPDSANIVALTLSLLVFSANIIMTAVPLFRNTVGKDWLSINDDGASRLY